MNLKFISRPPMIETGLVLEVYPERFQADVTTVVSQRTFKNVTYSVPYLNSQTGHGISFIPEKNSLCWIMTQDSDPLSHDQDFSASIIAWKPPRGNDGSHNSNRNPGNPGDVSFTTKAGNQVTLRSSGLVEIGSTSLSKTVYIPTTNTIHQLCQNLQIDASSGFMRWMTHVDEDDPDNPSTWIIGVRKLAGDKNAYVKFEAGNDIGGLTISVMKDGSDKSLEVKNGKPTGLMVKWDFTQEGFAILDCKETFDVTAKEIKFKSTKDTTFDVGEILKLKQKTLEVVSKQRITLQAPEINIVCDSLNVKTPDGLPLLVLKPGQPALLNETILDFILTHTHGGPPPAQPVNGAGARSKSSGIA